MLHQLVHNDQTIAQYQSQQAIIHHGIGPILYYTGSAMPLHSKASLLQQSMLPEWDKAMQKFAEEFEQPFIVFKGYALCQLIYPENWLRPFSDIDFMVDKKHYNRVENLMFNHAYQQIKSRAGHLISHQNSFYKHIRNKPRIIFDIHWQLNNRPEFHRHFPFDFIHKKSLKTSGFKTLDFPMAFLLAAFHNFAHRKEDRKHIWLYDMALLWLQMNKTQQKDTLTLAKQTQQLQITHKALYVLQHTFQMEQFVSDIPREVEKTQKYLGNRKLKIHDFKIRLTNIDGFTNKLKYIGEYLFQPHSYVQNRFALKSKRLLWFYYPLMWVQDILKLFKTNK